MEHQWVTGQEDNSVAEDKAAVFSDSETSDDEDLVGVLQEMKVASAFGEAWTDTEKPILNCYRIKFIPSPEDRSYKDFGLFVKAPLPEEAERMELDLHLSHWRSVMTEIIPAGTAPFNKEEIKLAEYFQELWLKVIFDRSDLVSESVPLGEKVTCSTFYLLLPVVLCDEDNIMVDWKTIRTCLSSPVLKTPAEATWKEVDPSDTHLHLANGCQSISNVKNSLVYVPYKKLFFFITDICEKKNAHSPYVQPLLRAKPLSNLHNLLQNRKPQHAKLTVARRLDEYFTDLRPELCQLKIIGFSKDIGSSISLLPSVMHRLENLLVAIDLKHTLSASFPEGAEVTASRVLEALTTDKCQERFSLERLEVLGDAFLKYVVGRHLFLLHDTLDEGKLTSKRSKAVSNKNLFKMATKRNLQVYIRDQPFDPQQFFAFGHPCPIICSKETESAIHSESKSCESKNAAVGEVRCSKGHHRLGKKTIADVVEALLGAFLVDSGFNAATSFLKWIGLTVDFEASQATNVCLASKRFKPLADCLDIGALETLLGYQFLHKGLLRQAFVHPSYNKHGGGCYQRLEFLGDAVLDYLITSYLFSGYPKLSPGEFTDLRSASVNNNAFANVAVDRSLQKFLISDSDALSEAIAEYVEFIGSLSGRGSLDGPKSPKVLGDLVESCFGAILLDTGFDLNRVWMVMLSFLDPIKNLSSIKLHPARELRELCQFHNLHLQFPESKKEGNFLIEAKVNLKDGCVAASAINKSKWVAIRIASEKLVEKLKARGYKVKNKSLEEILKATCKMDARLIGYDETPIDVPVPDNIAFAEMSLSQSFARANNADIPSTSNGADNDEPETSHLGVAVGLSGDSDAKSRGTGKLFKGTARSHLHKICSANSWKLPLFECCEEKGPSHLRQFTYKVTMEIEEGRDKILECHGDPKSKKTAAAESAAEAALWYLQQQGYLQ